MLVVKARHSLLFIFALTLLLGLLIAPPAIPGQLPPEFKDFEELSLESFTDMVIVTASKHQERLSEAPAFVTVITSEMIEDYGFESVAEALQIVPGMYVTYDKNIHHLGIRGMALQGDWNNRILLLLNGHLLKDQWYGASILGAVAGSNISSIERIEVVRGPTSSLYGSCAFFATINIITKKPEAVRELDLNGRYTHYTKSRNAELSFSKAFSNGPDLFISGSIQDTKGARLFFPEYSNFDLSMFVPDENGLNQHYLSADDFTGGFTSGTDFTRSGHVLGWLEWRGWTLQGMLASSKKGTPTGSFGSLFNDKNNYLKGDYNFVELKSQHQLRGNLDFMARVHYDGYYLTRQMAYNYYSLYPLLGYEPPYLPGPVVATSGIDDFCGGEAKFDWELTPWERVTVGAVYQSHQIGQREGELDSTFAHIEKERLPEAIQRIHLNFWDLYFQNQIRLGKNLNLIGAGNYSARDYSKSFFAPKMAVIFTDRKFGILKGILGQAFRAPSVLELTLDNGISQIGNPELVQEKVNTAEIIYERFFRGGLRVTVSGYEGIAENLISAREVHAGDPNHPGAPYLDIVNQYYNLDEIEFRGLEFGLEKQTRAGYSGFSNFGLQSVKDKKTGQTPPNSPRFLANFGFSAPLWKKIVRSSLLGRYVDERKAYDGQVAKSYFACDLWMHLNDMFPGLSIHAGVKNLLDSDIIDPIFEDYYPVVLLKHEGRRVVLNINYRLGI